MWKLELVVVFCTVLTGCSGLSVMAGAERPLTGEENDVEDKRIPGCWLGKTFHELEESWNPDVGEGSHDCLVCTCVPLVKKGILQKDGRINCRSVTDECPVADCNNPVLLPGQCCKTCPGKEPSPFQLPWELLPPTGFNQGGFLSDFAGTKEFISLLIGQGTMTSVDTHAAARGHFTLFHTSMSYSIVLSGSLTPTYLWFTNSQGSILHEYVIDKIEDAVICGTWANIPTVYLQYLLDGEMNVMLATSIHEKGHLSGQLMQHAATKEETFSSVLTTASQDGAGAVAMMTLDRRGKTLSLALIQRGFPAPYEKKSTIKLSFRRGKHLLKDIPVEMDFQTGQVMAEWTGLTKGDLKQMSRGKITLSLEGESGAEMKGKVTPKKSCNVLQSSLSAMDSENDVGAGAAAVFRLSDRGQLSYKIQFHSLRKKLRKITIENSRSKKGRTNTLCRVPKKAIEMSRENGDWQGMASGVCSKIDAREMNMLLQGQMSVKMETNDGNKGALRGHITELLYDDKFADSMETPFTLSNAAMGQRTATTGTGHAWVSLSSTCELHYLIVLSGLRGTLTARLQTRDGQDWLLEEFDGHMVRGSISKLPADVSTKLASGALYLVVANRRHPEGIVGTLLDLPSTCNNQQAPTDIFFNDAVDDSKEEDEFRCRFEGQFYEDGTSWQPDEGEMCKTCSCQLGEVVCQDVVCPVPECENPVLIPGDCCPQCIDSNSLSTKTCFFEGDKRRHHLGTTWHPFVPPFGYSKCVVCMCKDENEVDCKRLTCPLLRCPEHVAIYKSEDDCCKVCPDDYVPKESPVVESDLTQIQGDISPGSCQFQGANYGNGDTWHPRVRPFGEVMCVTCLCRDGSAECRRPKCPKLSCHENDVVRLPGSCCPRCQDGDHRGRQ